MFKYISQLRKHVSFPIYITRIYKLQGNEKLMTSLEYKLQSFLRIGRVYYENTLRK